MNQDYLYNTSAATLRARFEKPLEAFPAVTVVTVNDGIGTFAVSIPTADVYAPGSWLSRRFAGATFSRVEKWLADNGHFARSITIG